jgi:hypothetical protein
MPKAEKSEKLDRRNFLKGAGVAGVAGVASVALSGKDAEAAVTEDRQGGDYRETEHVMKYYELSRF